MQKKISLVTGGTGGIGTAICCQLTQQGCRAVAGFFPDEQQHATEWRDTQRASGYDVDIVAGDVTSFESSSEMGA